MARQDTSQETHIGVNWLFCWLKTALLPLKINKLWNELRDFMQRSAVA
jgi:hypothetical protein